MTIVTLIAGLWRRILSHAEYACDYGEPGCQGYRKPDPCERCHQDSFL